jgi:hypothetical protein
MYWLHEMHLSMLGMAPCGRCCMHSLAVPHMLGEMNVPHTAHVSFACIIGENTFVLKLHRRHSFTVSEGSFNPNGCTLTHRIFCTQSKRMQVVVNNLQQISSMLCNMKQRVPTSDSALHLRSCSGSDNKSCEQ